MKASCHGPQPSKTLPISKISLLLFIKTLGRDGRSDSAISKFLKESQFPYHSKAPSTAIDYHMPDDPFVQYEHLSKSWEHLGQSHRWKKQLKSSQSKKTAEAGVRKVSYNSDTQCSEAAGGIAQHRGRTHLK